MFKWTAFPFIRISFFLSLGIILYDFHEGIWSGLPWLQIAVMFLLALVIPFWIRKPMLKGVIYLLLMVYMGGLMAMLADESAVTGHYSSFERVEGFAGVVISDQTERDHYHRYEVAISMVAQPDSLSPAHGKVFLYVKKTPYAGSHLQYGDVVAVDKNFFPVSGPKNPHEFDYRAYLKKQKIYAHAFADHSEIRKIGHEAPNSLLAQALRIRTYARQKIADWIPQQRERAILTALILGVKDYLDEDTTSAYAAAGAMHVLAVSGLHVGIVVMILSVIFQKWKETRWGNVVFTIGSVAIIWLYALVTGFTPSVMRASTMFTVIIVSSAFKQRANIYNSLGLAAFVLILYNPYVIYAVGFQLSFAAVIGIVVLHPRLYRLLDFSGRVPDYIWSITCVSIAAQVATFPLALLYFHQFPTYFLVSNLIVIPAAFLMLGGGISMLLIGSILPALGGLLGVVLQGFSWVVNELILGIKWLPYPIFDWLYFDPLDTIFTYLIMSFLVLAIWKYSYHYMVLACLVAMTLTVWLNVKSFEQGNQKRMVFYEIDGVTAIDLINGKEAVLLTDDFSEANRELIAFQVNPNRLASGLPKVDDSWQLMSNSEWVEVHSCFDLIEWDGVRVILMKHMEDYQLTHPLEADVIYFKDPQTILHEGLLPVMVLLGTGFNYYDTRSAKDKFGSMKIEARSLSQDGFLELDLNQTRPFSQRNNQLATISE
ncbi:ComEC/Rec2 family competence protein [Marinoscillum sp.]|uniref:ComEC/Rec2 family competence protein n=1 Tax=Marinoscillum sp. TaxID=2024838 RepID=UPI003BA94022